MKISVLFKLLCFACAALAGSAYGQVYFSFSGGNGTPLSITLDTPVTFTVIRDGDTAPLFVIDGAAAGFEGYGQGFAQTGTYSVNGGQAFSVDSMSSGYSDYDLTSDDLYFYSFPGLSSLHVGDVVSLEAATFTTDIDLTELAPANGLYNFFIVDGPGIKLGTGISAIPEPSTYAMVAGALVLGVTFVVRRRRV